MENKIQELTNKLLQEGVEKGQAEAQRIIDEANAQAADIIANANAQAADIKAQAQKDAETTKENTVKELKMHTDQAVNALKTEIANVVSSTISKQAAEALTNDKEFMNNFMLKLAEKWGMQEDLVISTADAESLKAVFAKSAKALLDKGLKIEQVNGQKTAFTVAPADGAYKVNFGEEEFEAYFKNFLRPQLVEMLF